MKRRGDWWLSGPVDSTVLRPAGHRWLVTVRFAGGAVLRKWTASRDSADATVAEAEQLRRLRWWLS